MEEKNDIFKLYKNDVTVSNMTQLLDLLKEKEEIEQICKQNSLNIALMKNLFILASKGYNNTELAKKLGVHRVTVQRYSESLKEMKKEDFMKLFKYVIKEESV